VRAVPTAEETAAILAVLASLDDEAGAPEPEPAPSRWRTAGRNYEPYDAGMRVRSGARSR
jgi:hypothetical protein